MQASTAASFKRFHVLTVLTPRPAAAGTFRLHPDGADAGRAAALATLLRGMSHPHVAAVAEVVLDTGAGEGRGKLMVLRAFSSAGSLRDLLAGAVRSLLVLALVLLLLLVVVVVVQSVAADSARTVCRPTRCGHIRRSMAGRRPSRRRWRRWSAHWRAGRSWRGWPTSRRSAFPR